MKDVAERIDGYLLHGSPRKADVIADAVAVGGPPEAAPYQRALGAVGVRAADEALIALRLIFAGKAPGDEAVRRIRALSAVARAIASKDVGVANAAFKKDRDALRDVLDGPVTDAQHLDALRDPITRAYRAAL